MTDTNQFSATQAGTMSPEDYAQQQALNRQQRFAELLMAQGTQGQPAGQMVSGRYVPNSFFQNLLPAAQMMAGAYIGKQSDTKAAELAQKLRTQGNEDIYNVMTNLNGRPAQPSQELAGPANNGVAPSIQYPAVAPNPQAALQTALQSQSPQVKALIPALVQNQIPKKTDEMLNFEAAKADGFKGSFTDYKNKMNDYQKAELGLSGARLNLEQQKAAFEMQNGKPLNESQGKAAVFHSQMVGASNELNNLYSKGFNPNKPQSQVTTGMAGGAFNFLTPAAAQQAKQAQNQWTEAYLRFKTGAGTNAHEIEANRKTYFPDFGDQPDAIAQKARMREQAQNDIAMAAGPQGARMGVQSNPIAPISSNQPAQQVTPSLWGKATVVQENK